MNSATATIVEQAYEQWANTRLFWTDYFSDERKINLIDKATLMVETEGGQLCVSHFDRAFAAEDWKKIPLDQIVLRKEDFDWVSSFSREELAAELAELSPRDRKVRVYAKMCRDHGFIPIVTKPPMGFSDSELNEFEKIKNDLSSAECRRRYNEETGSRGFKAFQDALDQRAAYLRDKPIELTAEGYRGMSPSAIAQGLTNPRFAAAVSRLREKGLI